MYLRGMLQAVPPAWLTYINEAKENQDAAIGPGLIQR